MPNQPLYAGIDAGGTEFKCIVGASPEHIVAEARIPVTVPDETRAACLQFFNETLAGAGPVQALGIGSFGPVDLNPNSPNYGYITTTPKPGWADTEMAGFFARALQVPTAFDTDVNGAVLAEQRWGSARGLSNAVYITVGTGVGVGVMCEGRLLHGAMHPEAGHMRVARIPGDDFAGSCPFHGDCIEGLVAGPALAQRLGFNAKEAGEDHPVWQITAQYLGNLCMNLALAYAPERIILGGGVMSRPHLVPAIRAACMEALNGYLPSFTAERICAAGLGGRAGALGALALAQTVPIQD